MILVDTSIWIDHLKSGSPPLAGLLERRGALAHPWVTGELALGHLRRRQEVIGLIDRLPQATLATASEVMTLIERHELYGTGIGYVDAQLLAATKLTDAATLWTRDRHLRAATTRLGCAFEPGPSNDPA